MERLTKKSRYNEKIMTGLRTKQGVNLREIKKQFGNKYHELLMKNVEHFLQNSDLYEENHNIMLTKKGMFIADYIISLLFLD